MKTLLACIAILFAVCFVCCSNTSQEEKVPLYYVTTLKNNADIYSCTIKGHKYLVLRGVHQSGITHDETCHCRK